MNERIKEFAEQAGFNLWQDEEWNPGDVVDWSARYDNELEKFAELIVRECAKVAAQTPCPYDDEDARKTFGHTWDVACVESARDIRKHFGV